MMRAEQKAGGRARTMFGGESKWDVANATVKKYAYEAYPSWIAAHPEKACPDKLEELNAYMNNKDVRDPWGGSYKMLCGQGYRPGRRVSQYFPRARTARKALPTT